MIEKGELLRMVEALQRQKQIDREVIFRSMEAALAQAAKKQLGIEELPRVEIDRTTGEVRAWKDGEPVDPALLTLGRIAYQQVRQVFMQRLREAESDSVLKEYAHRQGDIVTAGIVRYEGPHLILKLGEKAEAIMLKSEQVPGESYRLGQQIRAYITEIEKKGTRIKIYLSRAHEDFVRRLFELEVPEIADHTVVIKGIAREPGYRTKLTVTSVNEKVDCLGACVGVRGSRIRNVVDELNGENVDIIRWSSDPQELIRNALKPAEVSDVNLKDGRATVYVSKDELSQAIGKGGRNVRLASKLTGWEIDIFELGATTPAPTGEPPASAEAEGAAPAADGTSAGAEESTKGSGE